VNGLAVVRLVIQVEVSGFGLVVGQSCLQEEQVVTTQTVERRSSPWLVLLVLCLGFFMIMLDTTIVNIAIPAMLDGLDASLDQILWVVNAYLLAYAMLLITAGRLGDLWGPRNLFVAGLLVFMVASLACGFAQNPAQMITARVVQGLGGALLTPQTLTIIATVFPPERRGAAMGVWGSVVGLATVAGPTLGGFLVNSVNWRWIFFVNVPIGIVALAGTFRFVPDPRPGVRHRLDLFGVSLATAGLFCLVFGLVEGERYDWGTISGPLTIPVMLVAGFVLLTAFALWERRPKEPLLPLSLFRLRNFSVMNGIQVLIAFGMFGVYLVLVLVLQSVLGMSALRAGLTLAPLSIASIFAAPVAGHLADRFGGKFVLMAGIALFAGGTALMIPAIALESGMSAFLLPNIVTGIGLGLCLAPLTAEAMRNIPPVRLGAASGMLNTTRQVGGVIGTAVVGALLQNRLAIALADQAREVGPRLPDDVRGAFVEAFSSAGTGGLQVAPGQTGGAQLPTGGSPETAATIQQAAHDVFVNGFVDAARLTVLLPIAVLVVGVFVCLLARSGNGATGPESKEEVEEIASSEVS
jgi:EmrB/QacA subfamily drug resistance transporter